MKTFTLHPDMADYHETAQTGMEIMAPSLTPVHC
jgi:hypothetical protein